MSANRAPHLLIVNHFALTPDQGGGTRHLEMGRELVRRGWRVTIAASDFHLLGRRYARRESAAVREALRETVDGVDFRWLWASEYVRNDHRRLANWLTFARSVISYPWRDDAPDIVIGSSPQPFAAVAARRVASKLGVPFLFEVRDLWPESLLVSGRRRGSFYAVLWIIARYLYSSAHRIIVLARGAAEYLAKQGIDAAKIEYIPNGADIASFLAPAVPNESERLRAVYAGAHGPANGLDTVLEAADLLRGDDRISFLLVGDGPAKDALLASAERMRLRNVEFADAVPKSEIPRLLARSDAGLMVLRDLPLFSYGVSPNKLFDYWGAGLPVICNVPGEVAGWVRSAAGGVQADGPSPQALADAVRQMLALGPERRMRMGEQGREWVRREHDRAMLAGRLHEILISMVERAS